MAVNGSLHVVRGCSPFDYSTSYTSKVFQSAMMGDFNGGDGVGVISFCGKGYGCNEGVVKASSLIVSLVAAAVAIG